MPNDYFQFKQFLVRQGHAAMKVTTDACLFGAWVAENFRHLTAHSKPIDALDIGTGTGLLSLMVAQKVNATIDAIEIDPAAAGQAAENFAVSNWKERLQVITADASTYLFQQQYDLIFSNPPFYENDLRSPDAAVNHARHDTGLTLADLAALVNRLLKQEGHFAVLLPYHRHHEFEKQATMQHLLPVKYLFIKPTLKHQYTRVIQLYKQSTNEPEEHQPVTSELVIKEVHHSYTTDFISYLQDYYISL
jgi:tRNA1Val (adenine37-N6)-methyltransferase